MSWKDNTEFKVEKFDAFGLNAWDKPIYIIRYKGFSDATVEEEFDKWIKEVDDLAIEKKTK